MYIQPYYLAGVHLTALTTYLLKSRIVQYMHILQQCRHLNVCLNDQRCASSEVIVTLCIYISAVFHFQLVFSAFHLFDEV